MRERSKDSHAPVKKITRTTHTQKRDPENNREFRLLWSNGPFPLTWLFPPRLYKVPVSLLQTAAYIPISPEAKTKQKKNP